MTRLLRRCPYFESLSHVLVGSETVVIKPHQVIVWVSVALREMINWDGRSPRFPAILDTGHSHNFSIQEDHLNRWAGIQRDSLPWIATMREAERRVPLHAASLWLHPNKPREREPMLDRDPIRLETPGGIAVYPVLRPPSGPRLPLLGMRAITADRLILTFDGEGREISVHVGRSWPNLRFLRR